MPKKNFSKIHFDNDLRSFDKIHYDNDKTLLVLGFHFHCLEIAGRYIGENYSPFTVMYQYHKKSLMEYIITSSRKKIC